MIFSAVLAAFIAALSPFAGLIFTISFGGKYLNRLYLFILLFALATAGMVAAKVIHIVTFFDVIVGVAIATYFYFEIMQRTGKFIYGIMIAAGLNCLYAILRQYFFGKQILEYVNIGLNEAETMIQSFPINNQELLASLPESRSLINAILTKYYIGTWMIPVILGLYVGSLLLSRQMHKKWHQRIVMPFPMIYLLIAGLILFIVPQTRIYGTNTLMTLAPLFIIQGVSILDFFWREFFKRSKFLLVLLIFSMVFNIPILILVALMGMLDIWFDFRKIRVMEENDENHSN